jgi:hypothetical protein
VLPENALQPTQRSSVDADIMSIGEAYDDVRGGARKADNSGHCSEEGPLEVSGCSSSSAEPDMPPTCNLDDLSSFLR